MLLSPSAVRYMTVLEGLILDPWVLLSLVKGEAETKGELGSQSNRPLCPCNKGPGTDSHSFLISCTPRIPMLTAFLFYSFLDFLPRHLAFSWFLSNDTIPWLAEYLRMRQTLESTVGRRPGDWLIHPSIHQTNTCWASSMWHVLPIARDKKRKNSFGVLSITGETRK